MQLGVEKAADIAIEKETEKLRKAEEAGDLVSEEKAKKIIEDANKVKSEIYVDDGSTGGSASDVLRMKGTKSPDGKFSGTISSILEEVGYQVKTIVQSGDQDREAISLLGGTGLGYGWDASKDIMYV